MKPGEFHGFGAPISHRPVRTGHRREVSAHRCYLEITITRPIVAVPASPVNASGWNLRRLLDGSGKRILEFMIALELDAAIQEAIQPFRLHEERIWRGAGAATCTRNRRCGLGVRTPHYPALVGGGGPIVTGAPTTRLAKSWSAEFIALNLPARLRLSVSNSTGPGSDRSAPSGCASSPDRARSRSSG